MSHPHRNFFLIEIVVELLGQVVGARAQLVLQERPGILEQGEH